MPHTTPERVTIRRHAMATEFSITIEHQDHRYARQAALEAWCELDRLENVLSRYRIDSDVSRIRRAPAGSVLTLDCDTYDCLEIAMQVESETRGAFNVAYAYQPARGSASLLQLSDTPPTVSVSANQVPVDLGGIGKGFALDRIAALLRQWDLTCFLLSASASTHLAGAPPENTPGWMVQFGPVSDRHRLYLCSAAFSASGMAVKGDHIRDPQTGQGATHFQTAWAGAASAARADAFSTALMIMHETAIQAFVEQNSDSLAYVLPRLDNRVRTLHSTPVDVYHPDQPM